VAVQFAAGMKVIYRPPGQSRSYLGTLQAVWEAEQAADVLLDVGTRLEAVSLRSLRPFQFSGEVAPVATAAPAPALAPQKPSAPQKSTGRFHHRGREERRDSEAADRRHSSTRPASQSAPPFEFGALFQPLVTDPFRPDTSAEAAGEWHGLFFFCDFHRSHGRLLRESRFQLQLTAFAAALDGEDERGGSREEEIDLEAAALEQAELAPGAGTASFVFPGPEEKDGLTLFWRFAPSAEALAAGRASRSRRAFHLLLTVLEADSGRLVAQGKAELLTAQLRQRSGGQTAYEMLRLTAVPAERVELLDLAADPLAAVYPSQLDGLLREGRHLQLRLSLETLAACASFTEALHGLPALQSLLHFLHNRSPPGPGDQCSRYIVLGLAFADLSLLAAPRLATAWQRVRQLVPRGYGLVLWPQPVGPNPSINPNPSDQRNPLVDSLAAVLQSVVRHHKFGLLFLLAPPLLSPAHANAHAPAAVSALQMLSALVGLVEASFDRGEAAGLGEVQFWDFQPLNCRGLPAAGPSAQLGLRWRHYLTLLPFQQLVAAFLVLRQLLLLGHHLQRPLRHDLFAHWFLGLGPSPALQVDLPAALLLFEFLGLLEHHLGHPAEAAAAHTPAASPRNGRHGHRRSVRPETAQLIVRGLETAYQEIASASPSALLSLGQERLQRYLLGSASFFVGAGFQESVSAVLGLLWERGKFFYDGPGRPEENLFEYLGLVNAALPQQLLPHSSAAHHSHSRPRHQLHYLARPFHEATLGSLLADLKVPVTRHGGSAAVLSVREFSFKAVQDGRDSLLAARGRGRSRSRSRSRSNSEAAAGRSRSRSTSRGSPREVEGREEEEKSRPDGQAEDFSLEEEFLGELLGLCRLSAPSPAQLAQLRSFGRRLFGQGVYCLADLLQLPGLLLRQSPTASASLDAAPERAREVLGQLLGLFFQQAEQAEPSAAPLTAFLRMKLLDGLLDAHLAEQGQRWSQGPAHGYGQGPGQGQGQGQEYWRGSQLQQQQYLRPHSQPSSFGLQYQRPI
jgi:hypothetical protein